MLLTAKNYFGRALRERGAPVRIVPKVDVIELSLALAREIAEKPILALRELKRCFYESVRSEQTAAAQTRRNCECKPTSLPIPKSLNASRVFIRVES